MSDWREKINDARIGITLVGIVVVAPKLPEYVSDSAAYVTLLAMLLLRESVVDGVVNLWRFITRQNP